MDEISPTFIAKMQASWVQEAEEAAKEIAGREEDVAAIALMEAADLVQVEEEWGYRISKLIGEKYTLRFRFADALSMNPNAERWFGNKLDDEFFTKVTEVIDGITSAYAHQLEVEHREFLDELGKIDHSNRVFRPMTIKELSERPEKEWLIERMIGHQEIGIVYGMPGSGKSFVLVDLAVTAAVGGTFARRFQVARPLNVAYCAGEGVAGLPGRFIEACRQRRISTEISNISFFPLVPQLKQTDGGESAHIFIAEQLQHQLLGGKPFDIIIIDTLHTASVGAEENSATDMGFVLSQIKRINKELKASVILAHHTNKGGTEERGSLALRASADVSIRTQPFGEGKGRFDMVCAKLKDDELWDKQRFNLIKGDNSAYIKWTLPAEHEKEIAAAAKHKQDKVQHKAMDAAIEACRNSYPDHLSKNALEQTVMESASVPKRAAREGIESAVREKIILTTTGERRATMHYLNPDLFNS